MHKIEKLDIGLVNYVWTICFGCVAYMCTYLNLDIEVVIAYGIMLLVDYTLGIARVVVMREGLSPHKMIAGIIAKASLWIMPFVLALAFRVIPIENLRFLIYIFFYMIILSELYSIGNNVRTISTKKKKLPDLDIFNIMASMIRNKIISLADRFKMPNNPDDKDHDIRS